MRINQFQGLITQASSYALPPGAFQDLVNFETTYPGQLTPREGLQTLSAPSGPADCIIVHIVPLPGDINNGDGALLFDSCGNIYIWPIDTETVRGPILCEDAVDLTTENTVALEVE